MDLRAKYDALCLSVASVRNELLSKMPKGSTEESLYKGTMILFSELLHKPKFMFVGINPGAGFFNSTGIKYRENELEPESSFEYVDGDNDYTLAKQTREVFSKTKHGADFPNSVKTNFHFTATKSEKDLNDFLNLVIDNYNVNLWELSKKWTQELIEIIEPQYIICEGKSVADKFASLLGVKFDWENDIGIGQFGPVKMISYKRLYSNISNHEALIELLNNLN